MSNLPKSLTVDGIRYIIDSDVSDVPQVWLHRYRGAPAAYYFSGTSLTEGSRSDNANYLRQLVRKQAAIRAHVI